jgi:hypothetical protein
MKTKNAKSDGIDPEIMDAPWEIILCTYTQLGIVLFMVQINLKFKK